MSVYTKYFFDEKNKDKILEAVSSLFKVSHERDIKSRIIFLDTFDSRLLNDSRTLVRNGEYYELYDLKKRRMLLKYRALQKKQLKFSAEFKDKCFESALSASIDARGLMPVAEAELDKNIYRVRNSAGKIVMHFSFERIFFINARGEHELADRSFNVMEIKEFQDVYNDFINSIPAFQIQAALDQRHGFEILLNSFISRSGSQDQQLVISQDLNISQAAIQVHRALFRKLEDNEKGVILNIDSECLHDFRVCIRKIRSALSMIKEVFPHDKLQFFKASFREIGRFTNSSRDIDVYLMEREKYIGVLPLELKEELNKFFNSMQAKGKREYKTLRHFLLSMEYLEFKSTWKKFINAPNIEKPGKDAMNPVLPLAKKYIYKRYKKVISKGLAISDKTSDAEFHQLRIECKKLRYLIDFFASLFHEKDVKYILSQLKNLQTCLGIFNDFRVQQSTLLEWILNIKNTRHASIKLAAALGGLTGFLEMEKKKQRVSFKGIFKKFARKSNQEIFESLFKNDRNVNLPSSS